MWYVLNFLLSEQYVLNFIPLSQVPPFGKDGQSVRMTKKRAFDHDDDDETSTLASDSETKASVKDNEGIFVLLFFFSFLDSNYSIS